MGAESITALAVLVVALTGAYQAWNTRKIHQELKTLNEGTVGSFAAAAETRRILELAPEDRTPTEQRHVDQAPQPEPPVGTGG